MSVMTLAAWVHDWSPWAIRFGPSFGVRWYGLSYLLAFVVAWRLLVWLCRRRAVAIRPERAADVILTAVLGVVAGGRLGYVIFYEPSLLTSLDSSPPWWGVLQLNRGGMASHGGIAGVILATWWIAKRFIEPGLIDRGAEVLTTPGRRMLHGLDAMALLTPSGLMLGRLANFINGELLGDVVAKPAVVGGGAAPWWSVRFPQEITDEHLRRVGVIRDRGPLLDDAAWAKLEDVVRGSGLWRTGDGFETAWDRVLERVQHGGAAGRELIAKIEPFISARHPSQLYQAAAEGVIVGAILWIMARRPVRPGMVGAMFMLSYGVLRVITEIWRLPDAQLAVQRFAGLSRGQWLSVGMVAVGVVAMVLIQRRGGGRVGGWAGKRG